MRVVKLFRALWYWHVWYWYRTQKKGRRQGEVRRKTAHTSVRVLPVRVITDHRTTSRSRAVTRRIRKETKAVRCEELVLHNASTGEIFAKFLWKESHTSMDFFDPAQISRQDRVLFLDVLAKSLSKYDPYTNDSRCIFHLADAFESHDRFSVTLIGTGRFEP